MNKPANVKNRKCLELLGIIDPKEERLSYKYIGYNVIVETDYQVPITYRTHTGKESFTGNSWTFNAHSSLLTDFFVLIGFNYPKTRSPTHIWVIPADKVGRMGFFEIPKSRLGEFEKYERTDYKDQIMGCYNIFWT